MYLNDHDPVIAADGDARAICRKASPALFAYDAKATEGHESHRAMVHCNLSVRILPGFGL